LKPAFRLARGEMQAGFISELPRESLSRVSAAFSCLRGGRLQTGLVSQLRALPFRARGLRLERFLPRLAGGGFGFRPSFLGF
jgi:hypothetical protein